MSTYKKLNKQDAYITTYSAKKSWVASGSFYDDYKILKLAGISGSLSDTLNSTDIRQSTSSLYNYNTALLYKSIHHLYYSLFDKAEILITGSYENYLQSSFNVSGSRHIHDTITVFSLPREVVGLNIEPGSIRITPDAQYPFDNYISGGYWADAVTGEDDYTETVGNLFGIPATGIDYINIEPDYVVETDPIPGQYLESDGDDRYTEAIIDDGEGNLYMEDTNPRIYVGNVIYTHGQLIIVNEIIAQYYNIYFNAVLTWKSNHPIYTHNYHCKIRESEYNFTYNPSALTVSKKPLYYNDGTLYKKSGKFVDGYRHNNVTGSAFQPYITTVGLYNDANELIAVGKMAQPVPKSANTEMTFIIKIDI
jgi:hypothetical protein